MLNLSNQGYDSGNVSRVMNELAGDSQVTELDLSDNNIGNESAKLIAQMLRENRVLTSLNLTGNVVGNVGARELSDALHSNTTLIALHLDNQRRGTIDSSLVRAIQDQLARNVRERRPSSPDTTPYDRLGKEAKFVEKALDVQPVESHELLYSLWRATVTFADRCIRQEPVRENFPFAVAFRLLNAFNRAMLVDKETKLLLLRVIQSYLTLGILAENYMSGSKEPLRFYEEVIREMQEAIDKFSHIAGEERGRIIRSSADARVVFTIDVLQEALKHLDTDQNSFIEFFQIVGSIVAGKFGNAAKFVSQKARSLSSGWYFDVLAVQFHGMQGRAHYGALEFLAFDSKDDWHVQFAKIEALDSILKFTSDERISKRALALLDTFCRCAGYIPQTGEYRGTLREEVRGRLIEALGELMHHPYEETGLRGYSESLLREARRKETNTLHALAVHYMDDNDHGQKWLTLLTPDEPSFPPSIPHKTPAETAVASSSHSSNTTLSFSSTDSSLSVSPIGIPAAAPSLIATDPKGRTALHHAARKGVGEVQKVLVQAQNEGVLHDLLLVLDKKGDTALHRAASCERNNIEVIRAILDAAKMEGIYGMLLLNRDTKLDAEPALFFLFLSAANHGWTEVHDEALDFTREHNLVKVMFCRFTKIRKHNWNPVAYAVRHGSEELINKYVGLAQEAGVLTDLFTAYDVGIGLLSAAFARGELGIFRKVLNFAKEQNLLREAIHFAGEEGILTYFVGCGDYFDVVQELITLARHLKMLPELFAFKSFHNNPLFCALYAEKWEVIQLYLNFPEKNLISFCVNSSLNGWNVLMGAIRENSQEVDVLQKLIMISKNVGVLESLLLMKTEQMWLPLHIYAGTLYQGMTPLFIAIERKNVNAIRALLQAAAQLGVLNQVLCQRNADGKLPLEFAYQEIVKLSDRQVMMKIIDLLNQAHQQSN
ncbi:MAG: hypothetical protein A3F09_04405 [Chlamydiae bacterium RIFCSPHIGHO2_12_FULL_49_11]|nr:MAG: hypothetical protein A3F09_04405 [Chlamydiae bacterium RIFCSPHIGHO2_12_FULL_49_11]